MLCTGSKQRPANSALEFLAQKTTNSARLCAPILATLDQSWDQDNSLHGDQLFAVKLGRGEMRRDEAQNR